MQFSNVQGIGLERFVICSKVLPNAFNVETDAATLMSGLFTGI